MFLYKGLLTISQYKMFIIWSFYLLTNTLHCLSYGNDLSPYITLTTLSIEIIFDGSNLSNGLKFYVNA